jgi:hypothetical protein
MLDHFARSQGSEGALIQTRSKLIGLQGVCEFLRPSHSYPMPAIEIEARIL